MQLIHIPQNTNDSNDPRIEWFYGCLSIQDGKKYFTRGTMKIHYPSPPV